MMDIVAQIVLRKSARQGKMFSMATVALKDATALDVAIAIIPPVFADAFQDTLEIDASIKLYSVKMSTAQ